MEFTKEFVDGQTTRELTVEFVDERTTRATVENVYGQIDTRSLTYQLMFDGQTYSYHHDRECSTDRLSRGEGGKEDLRSSKDLSYDSTSCIQNIAKKF